MNRLVYLGLILLCLALVALEAVAPSHGQRHLPGRYVLISIVGFGSLVFLAKVLLPLILSKSEDRDDW
jgi:hypothetical protein